MLMKFINIFELHIGGIGNLITQISYSYMPCSISLCP